MKIILYSYFFTLMFCFQIANTFARVINLHIQYFVSSIPQSCSVTFYSTDGFNRLDPIYDGDIRLPSYKLGEVFKVEFNFTDAQNNIWLPDSLVVILNENEDYRKNVIPSLSNSTFRFIIENEESYMRPKTLSIEFSSPIGYRTKALIPINWFEVLVGYSPSIINFSSLVEEPVVKDGYAVQVAVLNTKKTQEAFPGLDDLGRFYRVLEDEKYKYRIGTYPTEIRAGQVKDKAVTRGYKDAFVRWQPETILFGFPSSSEPSLLAEGFDPQTYESNYPRGMAVTSSEPSNIIPSTPQIYDTYSIRSAFISNEYYIQILATRAFQNEQQFGHLRQFGQIYIIPEGGFFKVRIGIFSNRTEAERIINQIRQQYRDAFIVSR
jgi:hypothetical protein